MDLSLKKTERLGSNKEFLKIYRCGTKRQTKNLVVYYLTGDFPDSKAGFVVSKKISKKAVKRNLVKRRLREAYRHLKPSLSCKVQIIFIGKAGIVSASFWEIYEEIRTVVTEICS